ncbi:Hypp5978 [Branchiostoma lanceolatum]|uniref:Hypp5978 protein n=1 Tax=Branchiostoma lanceolatum TaxID=7740 RepID=A0A8J9W042_BRALA|nr:Hypp5978 [Branchiostoma lanceolatum]
MMRDISRAAGLSKTYTNHSVRVTAIQILDEAGFEARVIMSISGHRNESSIRKYTHDSTEMQKEACSHALGAALDQGPSEKTDDCEQGCELAESDSSNAAVGQPNPNTHDQAVEKASNSLEPMAQVDRDTHVHVPAEGNSSYSLHTMSQLSSGQVHFYGPVAFNFK